MVDPNNPYTVAMDIFLRMGELVRAKCEADGLTVAQAAWDACVPEEDMARVDAGYMCLSPSAYFSILMWLGGLLD